MRKRLFWTYFTAEFVKFVIAGGLAAGANFFSRILFSFWVSYPIAIVFAYIVGMITAFLLTRAFVFYATEGLVLRQAKWFVIVNVLAVAQTLIVSIVMARFVLPFLGVDAHVETIGHLFGITVPIFTSYLGHKYWTFKR